MFRLSLVALTIFIGFTACSTATPVEPVEKPTVTPTPDPTPGPEPSPEPEPIEREGWKRQEFAFGFGSVLVPIGMEVTQTPFASTGEAPRYGGGTIALGRLTTAPITIGVFSAAAAELESGTHCGDILLDTLPGVDGLPEENQIWLTIQDGAGGFRYPTATIATDNPVGANCAALVEPPTADGGRVWAQISFTPDDFSNVQDSDVIEWSKSDEFLTALDIVRSLELR